MWIHESGVRSDVPTQVPDIGRDSISTTSLLHWELTNSMAILLSRVSVAMMALFAVLYATTPNIAAAENPAAEGVAGRRLLAEKEADKMRRTMPESDAKCTELVCDPNNPLFSCSKTIT